MAINLYSILVKQVEIHFLIPDGTVVCFYNAMDVKINPEWKEVLEQEFEKEYFKKIVAFLHREKREGKVIYPFSMKADWNREGGHTSKLWPFLSGKYESFPNAEAGALNTNGASSGARYNTSATVTPYCNIIWHRDT